VRDTVFCLLGSLRCRERMEAIIGILPDKRREALLLEISSSSALSSENAVARLCELSAASDRDARERMLRRWGPGFASEPAVIQRWLATRTPVTAR
jgi:hypothetical protein